MRRARVTRSALAVAVSATLVASFGCGQPAPFHGALIPDALPASPLKVRDSHGGLFDLATQKPRTVLVYFGYTHCPDVCPTVLQDVARARRLLSASEQGKLRFVFVSVDPERDSPVRAEQYARQFDSTFVGLAPTATELEAIKTAWGFAVERDSMPGMVGGGYGVSHPAGVFLVDRDGRVTMVFSPGTAPADLAADLNRIL